MVIRKYIGFTLAVAIVSPYVNIGSEVENWLTLKCLSVGGGGGGGGGHVNHGLPLQRIF